MLYALAIASIFLAMPLGYVLAWRGRFRALGLGFLFYAAAFFALVQLAARHEGEGYLRYAVIAMLVVIPAAGGTLMGMVFGLLRRRRERRAAGGA